MTRSSRISSRPPSRRRRRSDGFMAECAIGAVCRVCHTGWMSWKLSWRLDAVLAAVAVAVSLELVLGAAVTSVDVAVAEHAHWERSGIAATVSRGIWLFGDKTWMGYVAVVLAAALALYLRAWSPLLVVGAAWGALYVTVKPLQWVLHRQAPRSGIEDFPGVAGD